MVHQFKNNGYDIVLDVNSGAIHVVDDVTYDVIALFEDHSREEIIAQLQSRYPEQEIAEAIEETEQLKEQGDCLRKMLTNRRFLILRSARR